MFLQKGEKKEGGKKEGGAKPSMNLALLRRCHRRSANQEVEEGKNGKGEEKEEKGEGRDGVARSAG